mmetsp:Transcript_16669/g.24253  ORF Transcript_16669/g.24253 Transcript_16669/m.24253 type:complete len:207 (-) Transcript_16669:323-943(-)
MDDPDGTVTSPDELLLRSLLWEPSVSLGLLLPLPFVALSFPLRFSHSMSCIFLRNVSFSFSISCCFVRAASLSSVTLLWRNLYTSNCDCAVANSKLSLATCSSRDSVYSLAFASVTPLLLFGAFFVDSCADEDLDEEFLGGAEIGSDAFPVMSLLRPEDIDSLDWELSTPRTVCKLADAILAISESNPPPTAASPLCFEWKEFNSD